MNATEIARLLREEAERLLEAADILEPVGTMTDINREAEGFYAPWGYKADGTPRQKPGRKARSEN